MPDNLLRIDPTKFAPAQETDGLNAFVDSRVEAFNDSHAVKLNQPYIFDLVTHEKCFFQNVPLRLDVTTESAFASLDSPGRNNPLYHYTGAEDIIKFPITWYANIESKEDVIRKCKWLLSLTKSDGYKASIHPVKFIFGRMFKNSKFIVTEAPYTIRLFDREKGMLPGIAEQTISLRKISDTNTERSEILNFEY